MRKNWLDEEPSTHFSFQKWDFGHKVTKICSKTYINDFCFSPFLIDFYSFFLQKMKFSIKDFFSKCDQIRSPQETADLVTFTEEVFNGKFHFLCSVCLTIFSEIVPGFSSTTTNSALPLLNLRLNPSLYQEINKNSDFV